MKFIRGVAEFLGGLIVLVIIVTAAVIFSLAQFEVYKKKYGPDMTVIDYLLDPEVK